MGPYDHGDAFEQVALPVCAPAAVVAVSPPMPSSVADPDGVEAQIYKQIARKVAVKVAEKAKDMSIKFPTIVIKND